STYGKRGRTEQRKDAPCRSGRVRHRLRVDERMGCGSDLPGGGSQGWKVLGSRVEHDQGPRTVGGGAAQHVETDPAGGAVVPRRQLAPVAALLPVPCPPPQGTAGR